MPFKKPVIALISTVALSLQSCQSPKHLSDSRQMERQTKVKEQSATESRDTLCQQITAHTLESNTTQQLHTTQTAVILSDTLWLPVSPFPLAVPRLPASLTPYPVARTCKALLPPAEVPIPQPPAAAKYEPNSEPPRLVPAAVRHLTLTTAETQQGVQTLMQTQTEESRQTATTHQRTASENSTIQEQRAAVQTTSDRKPCDTSRQPSPLLLLLLTLSMLLLALLLVAFYRTRSQHRP